MATISVIYTVSNNQLAGFQEAILAIHPMPARDDKGDLYTFNTWVKELGKRHFLGMVTEYNRRQSRAADQAASNLIT